MRLRQSNLPLRFPMRQMPPRLPIKEAEIAGRENKDAAPGALTVQDGARTGIGNARKAIGKVPRGLDGVRKAREKGARGDRN